MLVFSKYIFRLEQYAYLGDIGHTLPGLRITTVLNITLPTSSADKLFFPCSGRRVGNALGCAKARSGVLNYCTYYVQIFSGNLTTARVIKMLNACNLNSLP